MSSTEFVNVGDLHFDKLFKHYGDLAIPYQIAEIRKPMDYALKHNIKRVVFLGDLADRPQFSEQALIALVLLLAEYTQKGLEIHILKGNHDVENRERHALVPIEQMIKKKILKNVHVYTKPKMVKWDGINVWFCPFPYEDKPPKDAVCFGHRECAGSMRDNGMVIKDSNHKVSKHHWIMGHLHTPHDVGKVHFVGTLYQTNFGESVEKSFTVTRADKSGKKIEVDNQRIKNDSAIKLINLEVSKPKDLKQLKNNPLYRYKLYCKEGVEIPKGLALDYNNIVEIIGFKNDKDLKALSQPESVEELAMRVTDGLEEFLKTRYDFNEDDVNKAYDKLKPLGILR